MIKISLRMLLSIPLLWFIYKGHTWAICAMFVLMMFGVEMCALLMIRLCERNRELLELVKQAADKKHLHDQRLTKILEDTFSAK